MIATFITERNRRVTQGITTDNVADVLRFAIRLPPKIAPVGRGIKQALDGEVRANGPRTRADIVDFATGYA